MSRCTDCINETICKGDRRKGSHANCFQPKVKDYPSYLDNPKPTRKQTNFERIKAMSIEEMAKLLIQYNEEWSDYETDSGRSYLEYDEALKAEIKWLEAEVEE